MTAGDSFQDHYAILDVSTDATPAQIRQAFLRLAKEHHPDIGGSTAVMQAYSVAYQTLMSPTQRKTYDLLHDFHSGKTSLKYHTSSADNGSAEIDDLSDEEIDEFLDTIYAEVRNQQKPKQGILQKLKQIL